MTKVMLVLALLMIAVLTMGMSQRAVAGDGSSFQSENPVDVYERALDCLRGQAGAERDLQTAIDGFRRLARAGWAIAQHRLAELYRAGTGVPRDRVTAYLWYQRAAVQHYPPARTALERLAGEMTEAELNQVDRMLAAATASQAEI